MDSSVYTTNVRDKMVLMILGVLSIGCLIAVSFGKADLKDTLFTIVGALCMAFRGNPATPTITEQTTTSSVETKTEAGNEPKEEPKQPVDIARQSMVIRP